MQDYTCSAVRCGQPVQFQGLCTEHYRDSARRLSTLRPDECSVTGCVGEVMATRFCAFHYYRNRRYGAAEMSRACGVCGVDISASHGARERCAPCAKRRLEELRRALGKKKEKRPVACYVCGEDTPPTNRDRRKCDRCSKVNTSRPCSSGDCDRYSFARGMCRMHYRRWERENGKVVSGPWDESRRAAYHRRRAVKRGAAIGKPFTNAEIFERDGWVCQLCDRKIDPATKWPHPRSASLDHVVPLSMGGAHSRENVTLACLECNVRKGNRAAGEQLCLIG